MDRNPRGWRLKTALVVVVAAVGALLPTGPTEADWAPDCSGNAYVAEVQRQDFTEQQYEIKAWPTALARRTVYPDDTDKVTNAVWHAVQNCITGLYDGLADGIYEQIKCHVAIQGLFPWAVGGETWDFETWRPKVPWTDALNVPDVRKACNWGGWPYAEIGGPYRPDISTDGTGLAVAPPDGLGQLDPSAAPAPGPAAADPQPAAADPQPQAAPPAAAAPQPQAPQPAAPPAQAAPPPASPAAQQPAQPPAQPRRTPRPAPSPRDTAPPPAQQPPPPPPPPPPPTVTVSWGARAPARICGGDTSCTYVVVTWNNFPDGDHAVTPHFDGQDDWCGGACSNTLSRTGANGSISDYWAVGYCQQAHAITATVDSTQSNSANTVDHGC
jgi:hypothetical protein